MSHSLGALYLVGNPTTRNVFSSIFEDKTNPIISHPLPYLRDPIAEYLIKKITEHLFEVDYEDHSKQSSSITQEDVQRISQIIAEAKKQGLEELDIKISKDFGAKLAAAATLPIEVPVNASLELNQNQFGEYTIKVKFQRPNEEMLKLQNLYELHQQGVLTDEEFAEAKKRIIDRM